MLAALAVSAEGLEALCFVSGLLNLVHDVGNNRLGDHEAARNSRKLDIRELHERQQAGANLRVTRTACSYILVVALLTEVHEELQVDLLKLFGVRASELHVRRSQHGLDLTIDEVDGLLVLVVVVGGAVVRNLVGLGQSVELLDRSAHTSLVPSLGSLATERTTAQQGELSHVEVHFTGTEIHLIERIVVGVLNDVHVDSSVFLLGHSRRNLEVDAAATHFLGIRAPGVVRTLVVAHLDLIADARIPILLELLVRELTSIVLSLRRVLNGKSSIANPRLTHATPLLEVAVLVEHDILFHSAGEIIIFSIVDEALHNLRVVAVLGIDEADTRVLAVEHELEDIAGSIDGAQTVTGAIDIVIVAGSPVGSLGEAEIVFDVGNQTCRVAGSLIGNSQSFLRIVVVEAHGNLQLQRVGQLSPL